MISDGLRLPCTDPRLHRGRGLSCGEASLSLPADLCAHLTVNIAYLCMCYNAVASVVKVFVG